MPNIQANTESNTYNTHIESSGKLFVLIFNKRSKIQKNILFLDTVLLTVQNTAFKLYNKHT